MTPTPAGRRLLAFAAAAALLLPGCGGGGGPRSVLSAATGHIGDIRAGELAVRFVLAPNVRPASAVGVLIQGSFALDPRQRLPVLHIAYTRLAGSQSTRVEIDSDGQSATVTTGGRRTSLTAQQQQLLASALQGPHGLGILPLHLDRWVASARQTRGPTLGGAATDQVAGTVNLPAALADLNQLSGGQVNRATGSTAYSKALERTLRSSSFLAIVGRRDHLLRRLALRISLAPVVRPASSAQPDQGLTVTLDVTLAPKPIPG